MKHNERLIYFMLSMVIMVWGLNVVMVKYLSFFPPVLISAIRISIGSLALLPIVLWKERKTSISRIDWMLIAAVALTSITLHHILLAWGVQSTSAGNASLILGLNPLATALLAAPLLGEALSRRKLLGITVGFGGVLLVVTNQSGGISLNGWGDLIVFASMLMYVAGGLLIRKVTERGVPVLVVTAYSHLIASAMLWLTAAAIYPLQTLTAIDTRPFTWLVILTSAILSSALGTVAWNYGIRQLGASRTAMFLNGMPLASLVFAAMFLGERLQPLHVLALLLIVTGVYLGSQKISTPKKAIEA
jgi:drug/metabolite transporter (DMT)-like permease